MERSADIEALVEKKAASLDEFAGDIMSCRVVVEPAGKHHRDGNQWEVRIDLTVAGDEISVTHEPGAHAEYKDIEVALRHAFDMARRQLEDYVRRRRGSVKTHEVLPHGRIKQLFPGEDYGFIEAPDGREIYFQRRSVVQNAFDRLQIGTEVTFVEEEGEKGPQASTVKLEGRHHHL
jgi:cold shock CspA family protein